MGSKSDFIRKAVLKHGDKYNYDKVVYVDQQTEVDIWCKKHGNFFTQTPFMHIRTHCPVCKSNEWILKAKEVHGDTYLYDNTVYRSTRHKVLVTCKTHGDFYTWPHDFIKGMGCRKCSHESQILNTDMTSIYQILICL